MTMIAMETTTVESFLDYYERIRERTMRVIGCIPPERIEWTWREGRFTFGDLIRHLATIERFMYAENVMMRPSRYPGHGRELADGYDEVLAFINRLHEQSMHIFRSLSDDDLYRRCITPGGASVPVWKWLRAMVEHEAHHRGQIYLYLSMIDVPTPPLYGLTSEEVFERSEQ
ncbi:MAG TPA: DinB family protein [Blastocatellia bacterium]|nr:DinB family protein [Blastocatellia bacterium]